MASISVTEQDLMVGVTANYAAAAAEAEQSVTAWANAHLRLPRGSGSTAHEDTLTPYWREPLALVYERIHGGGSGSRVEIITVVCANQVGKTWGLMSPVLAWIAATHPRDVGVVLPTHDTARSFAKDKLTDLFKKSPRLTGLLPVGRSARDKRLGSKSWELDRCRLYFLNGSVAQDLRRLDLPIMLADEFDALPANVQSAKKGEGEGSPFMLMRDRQKTFPHDSLWLGITTPTTVSSLGWQRLCAGTHERLHIACIGCGAHHWLNPRRLKATSDDLSSDQVELDDAARWHCPTCDHGHGSDDINHAVLAACMVRGFTAAGGWVSGVWKQDAEGKGAWKANATIDPATNKLQGVTKPTGIHRSFWLNALYSRFIPLGKYLANERRAAASSIDDQQAHCNGWAGEPWMLPAAAATAEQLLSVVNHTEDYQRGQSPFACQHLILTADQQGIVADRSWFPWVLRAWDGQDSAKVDSGIARGFGELTQLTKRTWPVGGTVRSIDMTAIDSANGPMQPAIRQWCAADPHRRMSILGSGTMAPSNPFAFIDADTPDKRKRLAGLRRAWVWNQPWFADFLYAHIEHLEGHGEWAIAPDEEVYYTDSLTSEERLVDIALVRGRRVVRPRWQPREFTTPEGKQEIRNDNHWLDCERMQLVVVVVRGWLLVPTPATGTGTGTRRTGTLGTIGHH
jgi:hypothetical protein